MSVLSNVKVRKVRQEIRCPSRNRQAIENWARIWVSDITYVRTNKGLLYVAAILALWRRKIVGWATGKTLPASLVIHVLDQALGHRNPKSILEYI